MQKTLKAKASVITRVPHLNYLIAPNTGVQFQTLHFGHHCAQSSVLACRQTQQKSQHTIWHAPFTLFACSVIPIGCPQATSYLEYLTWRTNWDKHSSALETNVKFPSHYTD